MRTRGALALTLCGALGCGAPTGAARPVPFAGTTKHYQPLAMKADAKRPGQAVILGTDDTNGSMVLPLPITPRTAVVDAMFVRHGGAGPVSGDSVAVILTTAPAVPTAPTAPTATTASSPTATTANAPIAPTPPSIYGVVPPGASDASTGARWNAALWSAAFVAATTLGKDLGDVTFSAVPAGPTDGVAASALIAGGFLATMTGEPIDPGATLAGMVNGDGTIGPVAGIPEQFLGAVAHGKTRLGYPSGMRFARSEVTGKEVDLVQLARGHHAEAVELATVYDAYRLLTRKPLPAPVPVSEADMALDPDTLHGLDTTYLAWQRRLADEWAPLLQLDQAGRLPATVRLMVRLARDRGERAEALHRAGKLPAAYGRMLAAWVYASGANDTYAVLTKLAAGDVDGAVAALAALEPTDASTEAMFARIGALRPSSLAGHLMMLAALEAALRGWAYHAFAVDAIRATTQFLTGFQGRSQTELGSRATADTAADTVAPTVMMMFRTVAELAVAEQELALERDQGIAYTCSPPNVSQLAAALQAVSAAGLGYVDTLLVDPLARGAGLTLDAARRRIASAEPDYLVAGPLSRVPADGLPHELAATWGDGSVGGSLLALAGHQVAYRGAAVLVARYDSFAVHANAAGKIDAVEPAEGFRHLLANAERSARAHARAARIATGAIPVQAKLAYQLATAEQAGDLDDRLDALAELWTASAVSLAAVALARN
jgi:hypothetical protein